MNGLPFALRNLALPLLMSGLLSACGGGEETTTVLSYSTGSVSSPTPTATPVPSPTPSPVVDEIVEPTPPPTEPSPSVSPSPSPTPSPTPAVTVIPSITPEPTPEPSSEPEPVVSPVLSPTPTTTPPTNPRPAPTVAKFGVFTETETSSGFTVSENATLTYEADFYPWEETLSTEIATTVDSNKALRWHWQPEAGWFGGGIGTVGTTSVDLTDFSAGNLSFRIQIPANVAFAIGIIDAGKGENWLEFPANQTSYGLVRNGEWAQAVIPIGDLTAGKVSLQSITYPFAFKSIDGAVPSEEFTVLLDDIIWEAESTDTRPDHCPEEASPYQFDLRCFSPEEIEHCEETGGSMQQTTGYFRWYQCIYTFTDGGTVCTDGSQCDSGSCRNNTIPVWSTNENPPTASGQCSSTSEIFGCYSEIVNGQAGWPLCRD